MTEGELTPRHIADLRDRANRIQRSRTKGFELLRNALRHFYLGLNIKPGNSIIDETLRNAAVNGNVEPVDVELAFQACAEDIKHHQAGVARREEELKGRNPLEVLIKEKLGEYQEFDEEDRPLPMPYHRVMADVWSGMRFFKNQRASQERFHVWMEWSVEHLRWTKLDLDDIKRRAMMVLRLNGVLSVSTMARHSSDTIKVVQNTMRAKDRHGNYLSVGDLDQCEDMVLDADGNAVSLITCERCEQREEDPITKKFAAVYDPDAKCPTWDHCMRVWSGMEDAVAKDDPVLIQMAKERSEYLQFIAGYAMLPHNDLHRLFYMYGKPGAGKSTFLDMLIEVMGEDFARPVDSTPFVERRGGRPPDPLIVLGAMVGVRLAVFSDLGSRGSLRGDQLKKLTGETFFQFKKLFHDPETARKAVLAIVQSNSKLPPGEDVEGLERRMRLVIWPSVIINRDEFIMDKLRAEMSGIFNWMLRGLKRYREYGEWCPQFIMQDTIDYLNQYSPIVRAFIKTRWQEQEGGEILLSDAYAEFLKWRVDEGYDQPDNGEPFRNRKIMPEATFREYIRKNFFKVERCGNRRGRPYVIYGAVALDDGIMESERFKPTTTDDFTDEDSGDKDF